MIIFVVAIQLVPSIVHVGFMVRECDREVLDLVLLQKQNGANANGHSLLYPQWKLIA